MKQTVLVVDDNDINRLNLKLLLKDSYQILEAGDLAGADEMLSGHRVDLVVLDLALPPEPDNPEIGMGYLKRLRAESPDTPVVVITGHDERSFATRAQEMGALDFFGKPFDPDEVKTTIDRSMETRWKVMREQDMERALQSQVNTEILGASEEMEKLRGLIEQVASAPSTVLIRGETGTGKELIARKLHAVSLRSNKPFIAINCAAMSAELLESELFGYEIGAFAGAGTRKLGWFERASGGTLFLDEIGDMPPEQQVNLLRVLEQGSLRRIGGDRDIPIDVRIIAATHIDLEQKIQQGEFREDLFYRLNVVNIELPPLSKRDGDIELLANYFFQRFRTKGRSGPRGFSREAIEAMRHHPWPGNVRELINRVQHAVIMADGPLIQRQDLGIERRDTKRQRITLKTARHEAEIRAINDALHRCNHNVSEAARELGISRVAIYRLMEKHGIAPR